jgi:hypothetical protein
MNEQDRLVALRDEIIRLIGAALDASGRHESELHRRDELHLAESARRDDLHVAEMQRRDDLHAHEMDAIRDALHTRDLIGQAKGVLVATLGCSPDHAFHLIRMQSQHENRKVVEISTEIVERASEGSRRPSRPLGGS